jgi:hypothetical protein
VGEPDAEPEAARTDEVQRECRLGERHRLAQLDGLHPGAERHPVDLPQREAQGDQGVRVPRELDGPHLAEALVAGRTEVAQVVVDR